MDLIAITLAGISSFFLWNTDHQVLKWIIISAAAITWYLRRVVTSIQRKERIVEPETVGFWARVCANSFWISVILSIIGLIKAF